MWLFIIKIIIGLIFALLSHHHLQSCNELLFPPGPFSNLWNVYWPWLLMLLHLRLGLGRSRPLNLEFILRIPWIKHQRHHLWMVAEWKLHYSTVVSFLNFLQTSTTHLINFKTSALYTTFDGNSCCSSFYRKIPWAYSLFRDQVTEIWMLYSLTRRQSRKPVYNGPFVVIHLRSFVALFLYTLKRISCFLFFKAETNFACMQNRHHGKTRKRFM